MLHGDSQLSKIHCFEDYFRNNENFNCLTLNVLKFEHQCACYIS